MELIHKASEYTIFFSFVVIIHITLSTHQNVNKTQSKNDISVPSTAQLNPIIVN